MSKSTSIKLTNFDQLDPSNILKKCLEREKEIKRIRSNGTLLEPQVEQEMFHLYSKIRRDYRTLLIDHISFVYHERRDIHSLLWKTCFYKQIEEFRQSIRSHASKLDGLYQLPNNNIAVHRDIEYEQMFITKLTATFISYLHDSIVFYNKILSDLEERITPAIYNSWVMNNSNNSSMNPVMMDYIIKSMHRCYLFLGDLSRYQQLYTTSTSEKKNVKNFSDALRYYERASLIMPSSGNTHNQMAVLSTYTDDEFLAVYHYCRSILIQEPFTPGFENLNVLYSKNSKIYELKNQNEYYQKLNHSIMAINNKSLKLNTFLYHFVYVNGLLFRWICNMHYEYSKISLDTQDSLYSKEMNQSYIKLTELLEPVHHKNSDHKEVMNIELFTDLLHQLLDSYSNYLVSNTIYAQGNDMLFIRVIVISIFAVHFAASKEANIIANNNIHTMNHEESHHHNVLESLALQVLYGLVNRTASFMVSNKLQKGAIDSLPAYTMLIGSLAVYSEWAICTRNYFTNTISTTATIVDGNIDNHHPISMPPKSYSNNYHQENVQNIFDEDCAPPSLFSDPDLVEEHKDNYQVNTISSTIDWDNKYNANKDILRTELRARSGMRASLSNLKDIIDRDISIYSTRSASKQKVPVGFTARTEHIHLRGFLPLAEYIEKTSFKDFNPIEKTVSNMSMSQERYHRSMSVSKLISISATASSSTLASNSNNPVNATINGSYSASSNSLKGLLDSPTVMLETNHSSNQIDISTATKHMMELTNQSDRVICGNEQISALFQKDIQNDYHLDLTTSDIGANNNMIDDFDINEFLDDNVVFKPAFTRGIQNSTSSLDALSNHYSREHLEDSLGVNLLSSNDLFYNSNSTVSSNNLLDITNNGAFDELLSDKNKLSSNLPHSNYSNNQMNDNSDSNFTPSTWQPWYDRINHSTTPETNVKKNNSYLGLYSGENSFMDVLNNDMNEHHHRSNTEFLSYPQSNLKLNTTTMNNNNNNNNDSYHDYDLGIANIDNFDTLLNDDVDIKTSDLNYQFDNSNSLLKNIVLNKTFSNIQSSDPSLNYSETAFSSEQSLSNNIYQPELYNNYTLTANSSRLFHTNHSLSSENISDNNNNQSIQSTKSIVFPPPPPGLGNLMAEQSLVLNQKEKELLNKQGGTIVASLINSPPPGLG